MGMPGIKNFEWTPEQLLSATEKGLDKATAKLAFIAQRKIKLLISRKHPPASKPGQPPHYRTRELLGSIMAEQLGSYHWQVGSPFKYALYLEFGTVKREAQRGVGELPGQYLMEPRPFLRPVLAIVRRIAPAVIAREVNAAAA